VLARQLLKSFGLSGRAVRELTLELRVGCLPRLTIVEAVTPDTFNGSEAETFATTFNITEVNSDEQPTSSA
jgi:hypothetical protein